MEAGKFLISKRSAQSIYGEEANEKNNHLEKTSGENTYYINKQTIEEKR